MPDRTKSASTVSSTARFPHSEIPGSKLVYQLPEAYRRFPRPSSANTPKASSYVLLRNEWALYLHPITLRQSGSDNSSSDVVYPAIIWRGCASPTLIFVVWHYFTAFLLLIFEKINAALVSNFQIARKRVVHFLPINLWCIWLKVNILRRSISWRNRWLFLFSN